VPSAAPVEEAGGHVAERELLALSPDDREDHDGGADVRDDQQQLQERSEDDLVVLPAARDVPDGIVEHRLVQRQCRDRRGEGDEEEDAEDPRPLLVGEHHGTLFLARIAGNPRGEE
jgi:hypothetical protein